MNRNLTVTPTARKIDEAHTIDEVHAALKSMAGKRFETTTGVPFTFSMDASGVRIVPSGGKGNSRPVSFDRLDGWIKRWFVKRERDPTGYVSGGKKASPSASFRVYLFHVFRVIDDRGLANGSSIASKASVGGTQARQPATGAPQVIAPPPRYPRQPAPIDIDALLAKQEQHRATGEAGEHMALAFEMERIRAKGCREPARFVNQVSKTNVAAGYDIESTWPGEERYIEVKSTTTPGADFFITRNEVEQLKRLVKKLGSTASRFRRALSSPCDPSAIP